MKYLLKGINGRDVMEVVLANRNITNLELLMNPTNENDTNVDLIHNIDKGAELIKEYIDKNIMILVDSDIDGFSSGAIMYKFLRDVNPYINLDYFIHSEKRHGLTEEAMKYITAGGNTPDLLIIPDASSGDFEMIEGLETIYNVRVLVIDHHEVDKESEYGIIINNQLCENTSSNLTGAGMTYMLCKKLTETYNCNIMKEISNLAMLGQIGDSSDTTENEVRKMCFDSLKSIENKMIQTVYNEKGKDLTELTISDLSFNGIIPLINAVTRVGSLGERTLVFEALADIDIERTWQVERKKKNKETGKFDKIVFDYNLHQYVFYICEQCVAKQNKILRATVKALDKDFREDLEVQVFINNDEDGKGISGLIANKLSDIYSKPTMILKEFSDGTLRGSMRGNEIVMPNFKEWCVNTRLFEMVEGHANAAGVCIKSENMDKLIEEIKKIKPLGRTIYVDKIYNRIPVEDINEVIEYDCLWKNGLKEPVFAMENIKIATSDIQWSKNTMRIYINGVTLIKFKVEEEAVNQMKEEEVITLDFIGKFKLNEWSGKRYLQVQIDDYEVVQDTFRDVFTENLIDFGVFA